MKTTTSQSFAMAKKIALGFFLIAFAQNSFAQSTNTATKSTSTNPAYEKVMTEKISKLENPNNIDEYSALANDFTRIADKEKTQWLPYYYTALAILQKGRLMMRNPEKLKELDGLMDDADKNIAKADELSPMNSEVYVLKKMSHGVRMMVNPQQRFMKEGAEGQKALAMAKSMNANNPRITILEAEDTYFTPEQFGGSKTKGMELFKKAQESFKTFKPKTSLDPNWGLKEVEYFLSPK